MHRSAERNTAMSTALSHHNRIPTAAAGAAVLAVVATGVVLGVTRDHDAKITSPGDQLGNSSYTLKGSSHQQGNWDHAGTTSGGKSQLGLP
jgi:hypothetical protein